MRRDVQRLQAWRVNIVPVNRNVVAIALSLLAGAAAATIVFVARAPDAETAQGAPVDAGTYFDQSAGTEARLRALEAAVAEERNARQLLEEELQILYAELDELSTAADQRQEGEEAGAQRFADVRENRERFEAMRQERQATANEWRIAQLVESGFSPDRAEWLARRESELQMEAMTARFEARAAGEALDPFGPLANPQSALRAEIGDVEYEQYLQASGRSTTVSVTSILESSPAQRAGLQAGDQIVSYNGTRVFDIGELNRYTMQGEPGNSVVIDIVRDGVPMQVVLPSGPIGVTIMRGNGRR